MKNIVNDADYAGVMAKIDALMAKGSANVTPEELAEIRELATRAQKFEKEKYQIDAPDTLVGMIEIKMYEMRIKQKELAEKLGISTTKLSLILNGKQRPDLPFLKAVHTELQISGDFILKHA